MTPKARPAIEWDGAALADLSTQLGYPMTPGEVGSAWRRTPRPRAHGFYRRAGFETIKTQHVFEKRIG